MKNLFVLILILLFMLPSSGKATNNTMISLDLSKCKWEFKELNQKDWMKATVPGTVHTDLFNIGKIPDLYYRNNEHKLQWIGEKDWEYKTHFTITEEMLQKDVVEIIFYGLDTYTNIKINDYEVLSTNNFFRTYKLDCKQWLKKGENIIHIVFKSAEKVTNDLKKKSYLKDDSKYIFARKPAYHFGWDWGPIYLTSGIWQPIIIKAWNKAQAENIQIKQVSLSPDKAELMNIIELRSTAYQRAEIRLTCIETGQTVNVSERLQYGQNYIYIYL